MTRPRAAALLSALAVVGCVSEVELVRAPAPQSATVGRWTAVDSATTRDLHRVWGSAPDDVWAVGDGGTAIHWDGRAWRNVPTGTGATLEGVWGARDGEAWAVGSEPGGMVLLRWNGERWSDAPLATRDRVRLRAVWGGGGAGELWAVGDTGEFPASPLWRWTGVAWRPETPPSARPPNLSAVGGRGPDVWFAGPAPVLLHRAGGAWMPPVNAPRGAQFAGDLCVARDGAVWVTSPASAVHRYRAPAWATLALDGGGALRGLWCGDGDDVWGVGDGGLVAHWDGAAWTVGRAGGADLASVWDSDVGERWAVGARGTVLRNGP